MSDIQGKSVLIAYVQNATFCHIQRKVLLLPGPLYSPAQSWYAPETPAGKTAAQQLNTQLSHSVSQVLNQNAAPYADSLQGHNDEAFPRHLQGWAATV